MEAAALADDLTGALEVGALLRAAGIAAWVTTRLHDFPAGDAVVVDTETRASAPADAARRVSQVAESLAARYLYKKTDSTLRGPLGAELQALSRLRPVVFTPAYPRLGRTVRNGRLYVHGVPVSETEFARDPRWPVREAEIGGLVGDSRIAVRDASTEEDLAALAEELRAHPDIIWAGSGGLAAHWAAGLPLARSPQPERPRLRDPLLVCGSRHPASLGQVETARRLGVRTLTPPLDAGGAPAAIVQALAGAAAQQAPRDLILFGGDTAFAVLERLGERDLEALGEVLPGVPVSRTPAGRLVVTKAGGFGEADTVARILEGTR